MSDIDVIRDGSEPDPGSESYVIPAAAQAAAGPFAAGTGERILRFASANLGLYAGSSVAFARAVVRDAIQTREPGLKPQHQELAGLLRAVAARSVALSSGGPGDIIQVYDPMLPVEVAPGAHIGIVTTRRRGNRLEVVDSDWNLDGRVTRHGWVSPESYSRHYGLTLEVWRFDREEADHTAVLTRLLCEDSIAH